MASECTERSAGEIDANLYLTRYPALATLAETPNTHTVCSNLPVRCGDLLRHSLKDLKVEGNTSLPDADTRLRPDNPLFHRPGFARIPVAKFGLYADEFRKLAHGTVR